jgi:RNA polymerase sigma-70 factor (ECF subfamily)
MDLADVDQIIRAVKNGDKERYGMIVGMYQQSIFRYIFHMLGQLQEAEDVTQDVFVKGLERLEQYREGTSFRAWLYKIAYHACLNKLRRAQIHDRILRLFSRSMPVFHAEQPDEGLEYNVELREALQRLAPKERHIILLRIVEENRFEEIADQLDISYSAVRKRYERAIKKLKRYLADKGAGENERGFSYL